MKILYYFRDYGTVMFKWQREHIADELQHNGHSFEIINPLDYRDTEEANRAIKEKIVSEKYTLFMTCLNEELLFIDTLDFIKRNGIPTLLFCPDNLLAPFNHEKISKHFDLIWLTSKETEYLFKEWGCNTVFLPYAANPYLLKPDYSMGEILSLGFIGTPHGSRMDYINYLVDNKIPVTVHTKTENTSQQLISATAQEYMKACASYMRYPIGRKILIASILDKFKKRELHLNSEYLMVKSQIEFTSIAKYSCSYAMMLSFSDAKSTGILKNPVPIINLRHFELPMSGALQFTTYNEEIASYFEDGKEIILCKSRDEYIEKARYYLSEARQKDRMAMKIAARKRAENEHTWMKRFSIVFDLMGIK